VFGQELNAETYAICRSDMMLKGQDATNIASATRFTEDGHAGRTFDYLLANPPFGGRVEEGRRPVATSTRRLGFAGRFGAGLPRINDGSFCSSST
jgi:type I restriction enzyme M protein